MREFTEEEKKKLQDIMNKREKIIFKDFKKIADVHEDTFLKYKDILPSHVIELWEKYGYGTFFNGFFKIINPDEYYGLWIEKTNFYPKAIPLFTTSFGDLIVYHKGYLNNLFLRKDDFKAISSVGNDFYSFFGDLNDASALERLFKYSLYEEAKKLYGEPGYDECFGFFPIIPTGGSEKLENIKIVKIKEHIQLHIELLGPIITD